MKIPMIFAEKLEPSPRSCGRAYVATAIDTAHLRVDDGERLWRCTREVGHPMPHIAHGAGTATVAGGNRVCAIWDEDRSTDSAVI